jgi:hypothetical protein
MPIGRARLEELRLKLAGTQERVRAAVAAEQEEILGMPERKYKNMLRSHRSQRIEMARKVGWAGGRVGGSAGWWVLWGLWGLVVWRLLVFLREVQRWLFAAAPQAAALQPACRQLCGLTTPSALPPPAGDCAQG